MARAGGLRRGPCLRSYNEPQTASRKQQPPEPSSSCTPLKKRQRLDTAVLRQPLPRQGEPLAIPSAVPAPRGSQTLVVPDRRDERGDCVATEPCAGCGLAIGDRAGTTSLRATALLSRGSGLG